MVTLAVDAMGGDFGPQVTVPAIVQALNAQQDLRVLLFGREKDIQSLLPAGNTFGVERLTVVHCDDVIGMAESPSSALRSKKDASLRRMLEAVRDGKADGCVSAGNTGALMAISRHVLNTSDSIDRPAIFSALPRADGRHTYVLDLGANVGCDSEQLYQFARMGRAVARVLDDNPDPRVALLNIGSEDIKGNDQVKLAHELIRQDEQLNYVGFVEGGDLFGDKADVVVCDGFVGNVALKTVEGFARYVMHEMQGSFAGGWFGRIMGWLIRPWLQGMEARLNPGRYNGAALIGLHGVVVKSHGNASATEFLHAVQVANDYVAKQLSVRLEQEL